jgi:hypothetical protein
MVSCDLTPWFRLEVRLALSRNFHDFAQALAFTGQHSASTGSTVFLGTIACLIGRFAHRVLSFARILFEIPGHFLGFIAGYLADYFFHGTLDFMLGTFGSVLVHDVLRS